MSLLARLDTWMAHRLPATRAMARLGIIAAVLSGVALGFHIGGPGGYALPLTGLLGAPANAILFRLLDSIHPLAKRGIWAGEEWNVYMLGFSACVALNWTLLGFAADLFGERRPSRSRRKPSAATPMQLTEADLDPLVREFHELERRHRESERSADGSYHRAA